MPKDDEPSILNNIDEEFLSSPIKKDFKPPLKKNKYSRNAFKID